MADIADIANDAEQARLERILKNYRTVVVRPSAQYCEDCNTEIPEARRLAIPGVTTCVQCQKTNELMINFRK